MRLKTIDGQPLQFGEMYEIIARNAFLDLLSDPVLRVRVLDQSPKTLNEALTTVLRMETYSEITSGADENNDDDRRKHVRYVSASTAKNSNSARRIKMLQQRISAQDREIDRLRSAADHADNTCFQSFQTKDLSTPPVGACGVTTDGRTAWQSAAGGGGQTDCNDVNYQGAEILASAQPGLATGLFGITACGCLVLIVLQLTAHQFNYALVLLNHRCAGFMHVSRSQCRLT